MCVCVCVWWQRRRPWPPQSRKDPIRGRRRYVGYYPYDHRPTISSLLICNSVWAYELIKKIAVCVLNCWQTGSIYTEKLFTSLNFFKRNFSPRDIVIRWWACDVYMSIFSNLQKRLKLLGIKLNLIFLLQADKCNF